MERYYEYELTNLDTPYIIKVAYNQKVVQIHRVESGINYKANYKALKALSTNAYALYMYLLMHEEKRIWALSSKDVYEKTSLTKNNYPKAVEELIEKGYLTQGKIDGGVTEFKENAYHLWEDPQNKVKKPIKDVKLDIDARTKVRGTPNGRVVTLSAETF